MTLYIKNMVCGRCISAVEGVLAQFGIRPLKIELGEVTVDETTIPADGLTALNTVLQQLGFELMDYRKGRMIEKIKNVVVTLLHYTDNKPRQKHSELIAQQLHFDYSHLSKLFSEVEGITIEQYIINQKTEKIKEYIIYKEMTLSDIADRMGYSSVAHLSSQFKKVTGLSPSHFKRIGTNIRKPLDMVGK
ncbi:MAG: helix-turn-helix domain-containing protein [Taibaiella sp.]|nr:helix-turn-helix domain-containing protein [Taibaiella sp.]